MSLWQISDILPWSWSIITGVFTCYWKRVESGELEPNGTFTSNRKYFVSLFLLFFIDCGLFWLFLYFFINLYKIWSNWNLFPNFYYAESEWNYFQKSFRIFDPIKRCNKIKINFGGCTCNTGPIQCPGYIGYVNDNLIYAFLHSLPHVNLKPIKIM